MGMQRVIQLAKFLTDCRDAGLSEDGIFSIVAAISGPQPA